MMNVGYILQYQKSGGRLTPKGWLPFGVVTADAKHTPEGVLDIIRSKYPQLEGYALRVALFHPLPGPRVGGEVPNVVVID